MTWHAAVDCLQRAGTPHVLATQVTASGSTPREPGAHMVITQEAVFDTLGGGTFEWQTIQAARDYLQQQRYGFHLEAFSLGGRSGQCCGGFVNILLEVFPGTEANIAIFGAGHVGQEIVKLSTPLPWQLHWYDSRNEAFNQHCKQPRLTCTALQNAKRSVAELPPLTHALVLTHSHDEDYQLTAALIERNDLASIGLIGSDSKWASFSGRLARSGYTAEQIQRVRCPIGRLNDQKLSNKTPYAIAISAVNELLWLVDTCLVGTYLVDTPTAQASRGLSSPALRTLFNVSSTTKS